MVVAWVAFGITLLPKAQIKNTSAPQWTLRMYQFCIRFVRHAVNNKPYVVRDAIAEKYLIPSVNVLFDKNYVNFAQLTLLSLEEFFLSKKTEKEFEDVLATFSPSAIAAGERFRAAFPLPSKKTEKPPSVGIIGHFVAVSGYEVILGLGPNLKAHNPRMYAMQAFDVENEETTRDAFLSSGYKFVVPTEPNVYDVFSLRSLALADPVDIAIWPLPPFHMFFLFSFGLAPKQVWFSQYLRPNIHFKYLDDKITPGGAGTQSLKSYNGKLWNIIPQVSRISGLTEAAEAMLSKTKPALVKNMFTPARLEKLKQPEFMEAVAEILRRNADTHFKWTGYYNDSEVNHFFAERGLADRHTYVPWLGSKALLEEIASAYIILACFPLSLGTVESMAAQLGTPVVSLYDRECNLYWRDIYWEAEQGNPVLKKVCMTEEGTSKILVATSAAEYIDAATKVLKDAELAATYRAVYRDSYDYTYLRNPNNVGKLLGDFFESLYERERTREVEI